MKKVTIAAGVICAVLALLNPTTTPFLKSQDDDSEPDPIIPLLQGVLNGRDGNEQIEIELSLEDAAILSYFLQQIGGNLVALSLQIGI